MSDVKRLVKAWINDNCCDGADRSKADCDWHKFTAPELYEMGDDIAEMIQEDIIDKLQAEKAELVAAIHQTIGWNESTGGCVEDVRMLHEVLNKLQ